MFIARKRLRLMVVFIIPTAVVLSTWMGVGGCAWPNSSRVSRKILTSIAFMNSAPNSTSAADAATNFKMVQLVRMAPLRKIGQQSFENGAEEEMSARSASPLRRRQVARVRMAIQHHVGRVESDGRVRIGRHVVKTWFTFSILYSVGTACIDAISLNDANIVKSTAHA